jgi:hypothetical protein
MLPCGLPADGIDVAVPVILADSAFPGLLPRLRHPVLPFDRHSPNRSLILVPVDPHSLLHPFAGGADPRPQTNVKEIVSDVLQKTTLPTRNRRFAYRQGRIGPHIGSYQNFPESIFSLPFFASFFVSLLFMMIIPLQVPSFSEKNLLSVAVF